MGPRPAEGASDLSSTRLRVPLMLQHERAWQGFAPENLY